MANTRKYVTPRTIIIASGIIALLAFWWYSHAKAERDALRGSGESTYTVARQNMTISVVESGSVKALNSVTIRSEMEGRTTIVSIIPEGTVLTEEDVKNGKVILELDASTMKEDLNRQQIEFNSAQADETDAKENLEIQKKQNESDISQAELAVKFGMMDMEKYLGQSAGDKLIEISKNRSLKDDDFISLTNDPNNTLGGESLQKYRQLTADIDLAQSEDLQAQNTLGWTEKLAEKEYVAKTELEADQLKAKRTKTSWDQAKTSLALFLEYEFPKEAQKLFSDYVEAERQLERTLAKARSQEAQAVAKLDSAKAKFSLEKERLEKLQRQITASVIKAPCPGMVVYATQGGRQGGRARTAMEVGRELYEREEVMSIPSASDVAIDTKVHETNIDKVIVGQQARITVDAMPDTVFMGEVLKISPLPDPSAFLSNPDLKLYSTDVSLKNNLNLRPGMSAKVEILIADLKNVIAVPVQCVSNRSGKKICFVHKLSGSEERVVSTGPYNDKFIQILDGLKEGEKILLNPPRAYEQPQTVPSFSSDSTTAPEPGAEQPQTEGRRQRPAGGMPSDTGSGMGAGPSGRPQGEGRQFTPPSGSDGSGRTPGMNRPQRNPAGGSQDTLQPGAQSPSQQSRPRGMNRPQSAQPQTQPGDSQ